MKLLIVKPQFKNTMLYYRLSLTELDQLCVSEDDEIAISQQRPLDRSSIGPPCVSSLEDRTFQFNLSECEPYIEVG